MSDRGNTVAQSGWAKCVVILAATFMLAIIILHADLGASSTLLLALVDRRKNIKAPTE